jgi:hypothetical protein
MGKALGTVLGGAAGYLLAPATGGASLALMSAGLGASIGGSLGAGEEQAGAAREAANVYGASADRASDVQRQMFERQVELQKPFREAGLRALGKLEGAADYTPFGMGQFQQDPGYAFRLGEGQKALDRQAAARGGLISGGALRAAQRYGQDMGSQEYQNAFNRYQAEREARLGPLQSLAGLAPTSANQLGAAGQQYGANIGNIGMGAGAAQGNALMAGAQARGSAYQGVGQQIGNFMGQPGMQNYLSSFNRQSYPSSFDQGTNIPMQPGGGY